MEEICFSCLGYLLMLCPLWCSLYNVQAHTGFCPSPQSWLLLGFSATNTCLTKQMDTWSSSFSVLLSMCPSLTSRQNSLTGGWMITPGFWPGGLSIASFKESAQKAKSSTGWRGLGASTACVISIMCKWRYWFIFQSVSPEGSLLVQKPSVDLVTNFTTAVQSCGDFRPSSPNPVESTRYPIGNYFGYPSVAQPGCSVSADQQATTYLPVGAGLSYDSNLPCSPTA